MPVLTGLIWVLAPVSAALVLAVVDPTGLRLAWRTLIEVVTSAPLRGETPNGADRPRESGLARLSLPDIVDMSPIVLQGRFEPRDHDTRLQTGALTLNHALLQTEHGGLKARTEPVRIVEGREYINRSTTFAARLGLGQREQIELRRIRPVTDDDHAVPASPLCQGRKPQLVGLWPGRGRMVMILWPEGATPGPDSPENAPCGIWSYRR